MRKFLFPVAILMCLSISEYGLAQETNYEKDYFDQARAKNFAIAAARYSQELYFLSKSMVYNESIEAAILFADTAKFYLGRSYTMTDSALAYAAADNPEAMRFVSESKRYLGETAQLIYSIEKATPLEASKLIGLNSVYASGNALIDLFNASLLLTDREYGRFSTEAIAGTDADFNQFYFKQLSLDDNILRLEADESAFTAMTNSYTTRMKELETVSQDLKKQIEDTDDPDLKAKLQKYVDDLDKEQELISDNLFRANDRLNTIRELLELSLLKKLEQYPEAKVQEPEFETDKKDYYVSNEIALDEELPVDLLYKIQIGFYRNAKTDRDFQGLYPITAESTAKRLHRYFCGKFYSYKDATEAKNYIRGNFIPDAFIVPYNNGVKISTSEAIRLELKRVAE